MADWASPLKSLGVRDYGVSEFFGGNRNSTTMQDYDDVRQPNIRYSPVSTPNPYLNSSADYINKYNPQTGRVLGIGTSSIAPSSSGSSKQTSTKNTLGDNSDNYDEDRKNLIEGYNISRDRLLSQLGYLGKAYESQRGSLRDALDSATKSVGTAKENAENYSSRQIGEAADTAKSVQRSNRNTLRALGILSSSAAGELLSKPMNEFDSQRANILEDLKVRKSTLDDYLTEQTNNNARLLSQLQMQYNQQVDNINNDLRFNDNERNSAIRELDKAIQSRIAEVKVAQMQLERNAQSYTSQLQTAWDQLNSAYTPVTNDVTAINDTSTSKLVDASVNPNTVGLYGDQRKRGLLAGYA